MKQLFIFLMTIATMTSCAQMKGKGKLYAYRQPVVTGKVDTQLDIDGTETKITPRGSSNLYIYLVTSSRAYPTELWIQGQRYAASVQSIKQTPVEIKNEGIPRDSDEIQLVPKTNEQVVRLTPVPAAGNKPTSKGKNLAGANELVVVYKQNGKMYYQVMPQFNRLNAAAKY